MRGGHHSGNERDRFCFFFLETRCIVQSESREKVGYSILSTDLAPSALRRLHSVISDFRPPSVAESGEAALPGLFASRAFGGYPLTSNDPAPGSLTVFPSSRVARPQDAANPYLGSLLSRLSSFIVGCVPAAHAYSCF